MSFEEETFTLEEAESAGPFEDAEATQRVLLEPRRGHTLDEVRSALKEAGVVSMHRLSASFLSVEATSAQLVEVEPLAKIHPKKQARPVTTPS